MGIGREIHLALHSFLLRFTFAQNRDTAPLSLSNALLSHANEGRPVAPPVWFRGMQNAEREYTGKTD